MAETLRDRWSSLTRKPAAPAPAADGDLPPGVLGYAVGVFPGDGPDCSGFTHTGRMTLEAARREAGAYGAAARQGPSGAFSGRCGYRAVEIREVGAGD